MHAESPVHSRGPLIVHEGHTLIVSTNHPQFSVVIPAYKQESMCIACVESVAQQMCDPTRYEIVVVDDGFTMSSTAVTTLSAMRSVNVIQQAHTGACGSRNTGIQMARGMYVVLIDHDCIASSNLIDSYDKYFTNHPGVAGVGGTVLPGPARGVVSAYAAYRGHLKQPIFRDGHVTAVITANACFRRDVLLDVGMFNTELDALQHSLGGEDQDLSYRMIRKGYTLGYCPDATVWHKHREQLGAFLSQQSRNGRGLALHCLLSSRCLSELGLPPFGLRSFLQHFLRYMFVSQPDCPSVLSRTLSYLRAEDLRVTSKLAFPCLDVMRRLAVLHGIWQGKRIWDATKTICPDNTER